MDEPVGPDATVPGEGPEGVYPATPDTQDPAGAGAIYTVIGHVTGVGTGAFYHQESAPWQ